MEIPLFRGMQHTLLELFRSASHLPRVKVKLGEAIVTLEVLSKSEDHQRGFMFRDPPDDSSGLLFVYSFMETRSFWMKNVHFDLDLLALDSQGRVCQVERLKAFDLRPVAIRSPVAKCIEVAAGFCSRHNVQIGTQLIVIS